MKHVFLNALQFTNHGLVLCTWVLSVKVGTFYRGLAVQMRLAAIELGVVTCCCYRVSDWIVLHEHAASFGLDHAWAARFTFVLQSCHHPLLLINGSLPLWINHADWFLHHFLIKLIFLTKAGLLRVPEPWIGPILGLVLRGVMPPRLRMILCRLRHRLMFSIILLVIDSWPPVCTILAAPRVDDFVNQAVIGERFGFAFRTPILSLAGLRLHRTRVHVLQWRMLIR